jgi:beta-N-acetylhexosaminidase
MAQIGRSHDRTARHTGLAFCAAVLMILTACAAPFASASRGIAPEGSPPTLPTWPAGTPAAARDLSLELVNARIAHMTLDQELGQLFIVTVTYPDFGSDLQQMLGPMNAGGVILYQSGINTIAQTRQLTSAMQHAAAIPLIIGADEEGDGDPQIEQIFGSHLDAWQIGSTGDPNVATREATSIGQQLKELGLNTDFAPVVDVLAVGWNWTRAFGRSPDLVSKMGAAEVDALQSQGVIATLKHFPGLGAMNCNPHFCLPVINTSRTYIEQNDLAPYRALMSHNPGMIMTTDLLMPALDAKMPAELSTPIVTGILRNELGYDGVVVTDALYMAGITETYSMAQAGVLAIEAGNDMLEGPATASEVQDMENALRQAVASGQITKARIDESVRRILLLKLRYGLLPGAPTGGQRDVAQGMGLPAASLGGSLSGWALVPERRLRAA